MGLFDVNVNATLQVPPELTAALAALLKKGDAIMNDLSQLQATMAKLQDKANETEQTLKDLAKAVIDANNATDKQVAIDALTAQAQSILDGLTTAEDEADDQVPAPAPTPEPTPPTP